MKLATRFDLGDTVYYYREDTEVPCKGIIQGIQIEAFATDYEVYYLVRFQGDRESLCSIQEDDLSIAAHITELRREQVG